MIWLYIIIAGFYLVAEGISRKRLGDRVIAHIDAAEARQVERERQAGLNANAAARWQG